MIYMEAAMYDQLPGYDALKLAIDYVVAGVNVPVELKDCLQEQDRRDLFPEDYINDQIPNAPAGWSGLQR